MRNGGTVLVLLLLLIGLFLFLDRGGLSLFALQQDQNETPSQTNFLSSLVGNTDAIDQDLIQGYGDISQLPLDDPFADGNLPSFDPVLDDGD